MSDKQFISNLSSTYADVRKLDVKKFNLKGKNILDYISENKTNVLDERGTNADDELDIWNSYITKNENGNVIVDMTPTPKEHDIHTVTDEQLSVLRSCAKVINNEVLDADDNHLMYWQTDGLTIGGQFGSWIDDNGVLRMGCESIMYFEDYFNGELIKNNNLTTFNSDLSSLTEGINMFSYCSNLNTFNSDLSSLTDGTTMFYGCSNLNTFNSDSSGSPVNLSSLEIGFDMFALCSNLNTFNSDLSSLTDGTNMFLNCSSLTTFTSDLSSLEIGNDMFTNCKLDAKSVANIITFLPTNETRGNILIGIGITNDEDSKQAFAEECYCDSWEELNQDFSDKNWNIQWQFNAEATTFDLRSPRPSTAVFAKLEEVIMPT